MDLTLAGSLVVEMEELMVDWRAFQLAEQKAETMADCSVDHLVASMVVRTVDK